MNTAQTLLIPFPELITSTSRIFFNQKLSTQKQKLANVCFSRKIVLPLRIEFDDVMTNNQKNIQKSKSDSYKVGLVDADLLCKGTRHPNLALLKIAGFLNDNNVPFDLIIDPNADISQYARIYMSRVFTFTEEPAFYLNASPSEKNKFHIAVLAIMRMRNL